MIEFGLFETDRHNRLGTMFPEGGHAIPADISASAINPLDIGRHYSLTQAKLTGAALLMFLGSIAGSACVSKEPEKTVDYIGVVVGEKYLSPQETQSMSVYNLVLQTQNGIKGFQVENYYTPDGKWVTKESLDAMVNISDRVRITSVPEKYSNLPAITVSAEKVQLLPKE